MGAGIRSRLFTKYVALFVAVVAVALLSNGIFEVFFYYREHKSALIRIQHEQAEAAAAKIGQFRQGNRKPARLDYPVAVVGRLDRAAPVPMPCACCARCRPSPNWRRSIRPARSACGLSRLAMDVVDSGLDLSKDAKFTEAVAHKVYYGPVYFRTGIGNPT